MTIQEINALLNSNYASVEEFKTKADWEFISGYQKLSEEFIREFKDLIDWDRISVSQKLSNEFIREFKDNVDWDKISKFQKLSEEFSKEFNLTIDSDNWLYKSTEDKKQAVIATGLYECYEDYFIAYKGIRSDRYSNFNFQYQYLKDGIYESHCDCTKNENSFGLSAWTKEKANSYCNQLVVKVKVNYEDVGKLVHDYWKIRCFKIQILE